MDAVEALLQFNKGREPERLALKYQRMRADAHAFDAAFDAGAFAHVRSV
ncbi:hypothetical protein HNP55_003076 [Paucibacter oligotrophus]|uniref:Uncharacterized protein n=1 Tax=Roseateles oligotrophus TaxID=1769250 RepID=A0A840LD11_9BURK|nr:hypothetical protein [Roseateles oligotrophus]MBB4844532.1 hypothetical protein [Roseateles oligotrophus]